MASSTLKLVLLGDSDVGKTSLLEQFAGSKQHNKASLPGNYNYTTGIAFKTRTLVCDGTSVTLQIWDWTTAKHHALRTLAPTYYRGIHGVIVVYDVTNQASFDNVRKWLQEIHKYSADSAVRLIVGNKSDLEGSRKVDLKTVKEYSDRLKVAHVETSATEKVGTEQTLITIIRQIRARTT